jgi:hypothetical protein
VGRSYDLRSAEDRALNGKPALDPLSHRSIATDVNRGSKVGTKARSAVIGSIVVSTVLEGAVVKLAGGVAVIRVGAPAEPENGC